MPTNKPIAREDRNDLIFPSANDKWDGDPRRDQAHARPVGRPVLVGTTSVETSEMISQMLKQASTASSTTVLNAKAEHAEREGNIVEDAGRLGSVMIATNMAGRGTDIKLRPIPNASELVKHWQKRATCCRTTPSRSMSDERTDCPGRVPAYGRAQQLGIKRKEADGIAMRR